MPNYRIEPEKEVARPDCEAPAIYSDRLVSLYSLTKDAPVLLTTPAEIEACERRIGVVWNPTILGYQTIGDARIKRTVGGSWFRTVDNNVVYVTLAECVSRGLLPGPSNE
jgi:hypothetical protein